MPRPRPFVAYFAVVALLLPHSGLFADEPRQGPTPQVVPGDRIRFTIDGSAENRLVGYVVESEGDSLLVLMKGAREGDPVKVSLPVTDGMEVYRGRRSWAVEGAVIGFVPGAILGFGYGCFDLMAPNSLGGERTFQSCSREGRGLALGVAAGSVGALLGLLVTTERWEPVRRKRVQVGVTPIAGHVWGARLSLRF